MDALTVSILTLVATNIGWFFIWHRQRQILERQIKAERERDSRQIVVPGRNENLRELRAWFEEGMEFGMLRRSVLSHEIENQRYHQWLQRAGPEAILASGIDGKSSGEAMAQVDSLAKMVSDLVLAVNETIETDKASERSNVVDKALRLIDKLEEQTAKSS